jgi:hypothetical protein
MANFHADDFVSDSDLSDSNKGKAMALSKKDTTLSQILFTRRVDMMS